MKAFLLVVAIVQLSDPSWVLAKEGQHLRALKKQGGGSPIFKIPAVSYSSVDFDGYSTGDDGSGDKKSKKSGKGKGSSSSSSSKGGKGGKGVSKSSKSSGKGKGHSSVDHSGNSGSESSKSGKENVSSSKGASKSSKSSDKGKGGRSSDSHSGSGSGSSKGKDTKKKPKRSKSSKSSKKGKGGSKSSKSGGKGSRDSSSSSEDKYSSIDEPHYGSSIDEPAPIHERPISPTIPPRVTTPAPVEPRLSPSPSRAPVPEPTNAPVPAPVFTAPPVPLLVDPRLTIVPTGKPTPQPTRKPSFSPTISPTTAPVAPTIPDVRVTPAPTTPPSNDPSLTPTRAPVVTPTDAPTAASEPIYICDICGGEGKVVTIPTGVVSIPTQGEFTCTAIQGAAAAGLIPESGCGPLTVLTQEPCGCEAPNDPTNAPSSSKSTVQLTIEKFALQDGEEFEDPDSYQSVALRRVEAQDGVATMNDSKLAQYYSLYCIFESTNGKSNDMIENEPAFSGIDIPGWTITTGWLENNMDPCDGWHGVECENDQVVSLNLYDNTMTGNFAPEVILLASDGQHSTGAGSLRLLDIFNNEFLSNDGDSSWMESLGSDLQYLYLQGTSFTGNLPTFSTGLIELDLSSTFYSGGLIGSNFEGLDSLNLLIFDDCQFDSSIPTEIAALPNLEFFYASDAMITGDLSYMKNMPSIFEHFVSNNPKLGGQIYSFIGDLSTLNSFSAAGCGLEGRIPPELGKLPSMQQLWLYDNQLTGEIPESIGDLLFMSTFEVEGNNLSGSMPNKLCNNFDLFLSKLGADCSEVDCPCCTCCTTQECRAME